LFISADLLSPSFQVAAPNARVLLVKMSSLGDVVQTLAAVTDAARNVPGIQFDWVVEEAYVEIPRWHPAVHRVIPAALRRWRKSFLGTLLSSEWLKFRRELRRDSYDLVLDAQGLYKSAWVAAQARGPVAGRSLGTAREGGAALLFSRRYRVPQEGPEVEQVRSLFAAALGYSKPVVAADFGIDRTKLSGSESANNSVVFVHGAAWETKLWPVENWIELGLALQRRGCKVRLPWGSDAERARAERIALACGGEVLPKLGFGGIGSILAGSALVVGLDTGLTHLAVALGVPVVTLYGPTTPVYGAVAGARLINLSSSEENVIDTSRPNTVAVERVLQAIDAEFPNR
jgi:heptosyltransferase-1